MRIERNLTSGNDAPHTPFKTQESNLQRDDASFFSAQMESSARPVTASSPSNLLTDVSNQLIKSTTGMSKGLRAYSTGNKEKDSANYAANLSDSMLLTTVLTKSVGKTAQFLEKISNLQ
ncbi:hypothetical protein [Pseudomonas antarctica]|uniref:hypothetical protein n=1 Tax=Pseudomonas antarctica TaxID=219572 RepID=UPI003F754320